MDRQAFLQRVAQAVRQGARHRVHVPPVERPEREPTSPSQRLRRFLREVEQVGGMAVACTDAQQAKQQVLTWLRAHGTESLLCWQHPVLEQLELAQFLEQQGLRLWLPEELQRLPEDQRRRVLFSAGAGLTGVELAVAESGTIVLPAAARQFRSASLLPPVAVAVVRADQVVDDLFDLFEHWRGEDRFPHYAALVTGPSKTGDIQLQLTTGVHGPGHWYVLLWDPERQLEPPGP